MQFWCVFGQVGLDVIFGLIFTLFVYTLSFDNFLGFGGRIS